MSHESKTALQWNKWPDRVRKTGDITSATTLRIHTPHESSWLPVHTPPQSRPHLTGHWSDRALLQDAYRWQPPSGLLRSSLHSSQRSILVHSGFFPLERPERREEVMLRLLCKGKKKKNLAGFRAHCLWLKNGVVCISTCLIFSLSQPRCSQEPVAGTLVRHDTIRKVGPTVVIVVVLA